MRANATVPRKRRERGPPTRVFWGDLGQKGKVKKPRRPPSTSVEETLSVKKEQLSNRVPLPGKKRVTVSRLSTCQTALCVGRRASLKRVLKVCYDPPSFVERSLQPTIHEFSPFSVAHADFTSTSKVSAKFAS